MAFKSKSRDDSDFSPSDSFGVGDVVDNPDGVPASDEGTAKRTRAQGILDELQVVEPPKARGGGRSGLDERTIRAREFIKENKGSFVLTGRYSNRGAIPVALQQIDGMRVDGRWAPSDTNPGEYDLYLKLTDTPFVVRTRTRKTKTDDTQSDNSDTAA